MGQPAQVYSPGGHGHGLGLRYCHLSITHAHARVMRVFLFFFACRMSAPKEVDHVQIDSCCQCLQPHLSSVFFTATSESCHLSHFSIHRWPPFPYGNFWDPMRCCVGWYTATLVCFLIFSFFFFFLLTSSFAAKSSHTTLLADGHGRHFPLGPTGPHTNYLEGYVAFAQDARLSHRARPPPRSDAFAQHAARTSHLLRVAQGRSA